MTAPTSSKTSTVGKTTESTKEKNRIKLAGIEYAEKKHTEYFIESSIADNASTFPKFDKQQLNLGKVLGKGGFSTVYEVREVQVVDSSCETKTTTDECQFIADHCLRESERTHYKNGGDARYAIKLLSPEVVADNGKFIQGIIDMATETRVLSDTEHPNIVKVRAFAHVSPFHDEYFIMMDRLYDTMESRITKWAKKVKQNSGLGGRMFDRKGLKKKKLWEDKIMAAFDLSSALGYLHGRKIVYRDLKPENIGFDVRDDVKLFDFGFATEMKDSRRASNDLYNLTGMTGSPRYMSPEVANEENYNEKCDVYSFAILVWEMLATKTPFEVYTMTTLRKRVWNGEHTRPFIDSSWPESVSELLENSWSKEISTRPSFEQITETLRKECVKARGGNDEGLEHSRRRSTFVFNDRSN